MYNNFITQIEAYARENMPTLLESLREDRAEVFAPLKGLSARKLLSEAEVEKCFKVSIDKALEIFDRIASRHSIDVWLSVVRKFPPIPFLHPAWPAHTTLAILKYAEPHQDTTYGQVASDGIFGVKLAYTDQDLVDAVRLAGLGSNVAELLVAKRGYSKGQRIIVDHDGTFLITGTPEVNQAIDEYMRRSARLQYPLAYTGIPTHEFSQAEGPFFFTLSPASFENHSESAPCGIPLFVERLNLTLFLPYVLKANNLKALESLLDHYSDALIDRFGIHPDAIVNFLSTLTTLIQRTTPPWQVDSSKSGLILMASDHEGHVDHQLQFMQAFLWQGYLRFPADHLRKTLLREASDTPKGSTKKDSAIDFLEAFHSFENRDKIDPVLLRPFPFLYASPSGNCYIDLLFVEDSLAWMIEEARTWYSTQHGDRFTLASKRALEAYLGKGAVVAYKKKYPTGRGNKQREVDLLVRADDTLWIIECKAHGKSREFWAGSRKATNQRTVQCAKAVAQAKEAYEAVRYSQSSMPLELRQLKVDWVVCTPSQEFISPTDRFGELAPGIPRVCTLEELIRFLGYSRSSA